VSPGEPASAAALDKDEARYRYDSAAFLVALKTYPPADLDKGSRRAFSFNGMDTTLVRPLFGGPISEE